MIIKIVFNILFYSIFFYGNMFAKDLLFSGNKKLSINDLQSLTSINLDQSEFNINEVQIILKDIYSSELISNISLTETSDSYILNIDEAKIIENIYFNGNISIKNDDLINNIISKSNSLFNRNTLLKDIDTIEKFYLSKGFNNISIKASTEKYSEDKVNLIFDIYEDDPSKIIKIKFKGNKFFSDRFLRSLINSSEDSFLNFLSPGVNLNNNVFQFDSSLIKNQYLNYGFNDVKVSYDLSETEIKNNKLLTFYIFEGTKYLIKDIQFNIISESLNDQLQPLFNNLEDYFLKNGFQLDQEIIINKVQEINDYLNSKNIYSSFFEFEINYINDSFEILIYEVISDPLYVNTINIYGNSITKEKTIRSNIDLEPGDYFDKSVLNKSIQNLQNKKYIKNTNVDFNENDNKIDINIEIEENAKTGQFLIGGNYSGDTGFGVASTLLDDNLFGSGNQLKTTIDFNSENLKYDINYTYYSLKNNNLSYTYKIFNLDKDLESSYGYKSKQQGAGLFFNFDYSKNLRITPGFEIIKSKGYSAQDNLSFINDNINSNNKYIFSLILSYDTTNDRLYPTNGYQNSISFEYIPDLNFNSSYYRINYTNESYLEFQKSSNFIFNKNDFGLINKTNSNDKIKTIDTFSLGGNSFKGFDYRGIGPISSDYYLGGNKYFTSTFGYGSSFFLEEDNINIKLFYSVGSLWGNDYSNDDSFKLRSSIGLSFDIMTPLLPITFSYAVPINKKSDDRIKNFNFSIGTSF